jgi:hypothetical protein
VTDDGTGVEASPLHREPRDGRNVAQSRPYRACTAQVVAATRATTTAHTLGPLAVAVCPDTADSGLLA